MTEPVDDIVGLAERLTEEQRRLLLAFDPTLEEQPVTEEQWDAILCPATYYIGEWPMHRWFCSSSASYYGDGGPWHLAFQYNEFGLQLRDALRARAAQESKP